MQKPWVRALFIFFVSLIGFESVTGLVWLFTTSDKLHEICLWGGFVGAALLAMREHDSPHPDPP